jgi:hypothetical protein
MDRAGGFVAMAGFAAREWVGEESVLPDRAPTFCALGAAGWATTGGLAAGGFTGFCGDVCAHEIAPSQSARIKLLLFIALSYFFAAADGTPPLEVL